MQKFYKIVTLLCFIPIFGNAQPKVIDEIIGVVGQNIISRSELDFEITQIESQYGQITPADRCELFESQLVKKLMLNQALLDSIVVTDDDVESELDKKIRYFTGQVGSTEKLEKYLGKTILEYKNEIRPKIKEQLLIKKFETENFGQLKVSHREVKKYFDSIPIDSLPRIEAEYEIGQLVVKPTYSIGAKIYAFEKAKSLRNRVLNGESFELLAGAYSDDPGSAKEGGRLPEFGRGEMVGEFEANSFKLKPDSISEIFETEYGYHFIKLISRLGDRISARHILIKPLITETEQSKTAQKMDSIYKVLTNKKMTFCDAVATYSNIENSNCGMLQDPYSGLFKVGLDVIDPAVAKAVTYMGIGTFKYPELFYMPDGTIAYRIIYLKSETKAHIANLSQDYARVQIATLEAKKNEEIIKWVDKTKPKTFIRLDPNYMDCNLSDWINFTEE